MIPPFPPLPELLGGCPRCERWYGLSSSSPGFWSHHHQPALFQTRVLAGIPQSGSPGQTAMKLLGFRLQQNPTSPSLEKRGYRAQRYKTSRAEQGYQTSRFREENCPSSSCQGTWAAGEEPVGTCSQAESQEAAACLPSASPPKKPTAFVELLLTGNADRAAAKHADGCFGRISN